MHQNELIPAVSHNASLKETLLEMTQKKLGMTTIVNDEGDLIGVFTDGDVRRVLDNKVDIHQTPISALMSTHPKTITKEILAAEALHLMETHKITALVAVDSAGKPEGIIHIHDILRAGVI
jgi:arabinose-5-phosphate isomerase